MPEGDTLFRIAAVLQPIVGLPVLDAELPRGPDARGLIGQTVLEVASRGKNLLVHFSGGLTLHVHLKMSGTVRLFDASRRWSRDRPAPSLVVHLEVPGFQVVILRAPVVRLVPTRRLAVDPRLGALGPDVLDDAFDPRAVAGRLHASAAPLGDALLDQSVLAGVGNVFKSEVLFNRKLDPFRPAAAVDLDTLVALLEHVRTVMRANATSGTGPATPLTPYRYTRATRPDGKAALSVYGRAGERCFDCGTPVHMRRQANQRSTYYCPRCQGVSG